MIGTIVAGRFGPEHGRNIQTRRPAFDALDAFAQTIEDNGSVSAVGRGGSHLLDRVLRYGLTQTHDVPLIIE
jgi:hypothetical protein